MNTPLKLAITFLVLTAAGCAGNPINSSAAGATQAPRPAVDAGPVLTRSGEPVTLRSGEPVTGRDWNCPRCYK